MVSAHRIAILPSTPAARRVSAAVALANPPPSSKKSTSCASLVGICFDLNNCARASLFNHSAWGCRTKLLVTDDADRGGTTVTYVRPRRFQRRGSTHALDSEVVGR